MYLLSELPHRLSNPTAKNPTVNSPKNTTTLHLIWGREAVSRYKIGMIDNAVRLAHSVYDFVHPALAQAFLMGVSEARQPDDWMLITDQMDIKRLGMPLRSRLIEAARKGDVQAVRALVSTGVKIDSTDGNGLNALHHAAQEGQAEVIAVLVDAGADVDAKTENGLAKTPLHLASESAQPGTAQAVDALVQGRADVNARDAKGNSPLHSLFEGADGQRGSADAKAQSLLKDGGADPRHENNAQQRAGSTLGALASAGGLLAAIMDIVNEQEQALEEKENSRLSAMTRTRQQPAPGPVSGSA
jgi:hypothetical protein